MDTTAPVPPVPPPAKPAQGLLRRLLSWLLNEPLLCWLAAACVLVALFYLEEDWRGRRAWQQCKRAIEAKGVVLDWNAHIPEPVPGEQNFFAAPNMAQWFVGRGGNALSQRLNLSNFYQSNRQTSGVIAQLTIVPTNAEPASAEADLVVDYNASILTADPAESDAGRGPDLHGPIIPLIVMDEVPLTDAIKALARQAKLNYTLDPELNLGPTSPSGEHPSQPLVSIRWEDVTGMQALVALLNNYALRLVDDPGSGTSRIVANKNGATWVYVELGLRRRLDKLAETGRLVDDAHGAVHSLKGAQGVILLGPGAEPTRMAQIAVRSTTPLKPEQVVAFFSPTSRGIPSSGLLQAVPAGTNQFVLRFSPPCYFSAPEYLAWSDQFDDEFEQINQALKRPYAQMVGDYRDPVTLPIPNFVAVRMLVQTLSQRAQSHLLLGQPEAALRDLTLVNDVCRLLEAKPTGKPMTLVASMINVAVRGLYVSVVADGLRLQVWREPELKVIQEQLRKVNLAPLVAESMAEERAAGCRILETCSGSRFANALSSGTAAPTLWSKLKDPTFLFFTFAPRGWVYQNMTAIASMHGKMLEGYDQRAGRVIPHTLDQTCRESIATLEHPSPFTFLAAICIPNYTKAWQTLAHNQSMADQAQIACALERYRLAQGHYPEALTALLPEFIGAFPADIVNGQPLHYRRLANDRFLLYSVGWNERDEGGLPGEREKGDWVWEASPS